MLNNVNKNRVGTYECEVKSLNDQLLMEAHHMLGTSPKVDREKQDDVIILEGNDVNLNCDVIGDPTPNITWFMVIQIDSHRNIFTTQ